MDEEISKLVIDRRKARVIAADYCDKLRDDPRIRLLTIHSGMIDAITDYMEMLYEEAYRIGYSHARHPIEHESEYPGEPSE